MNHQCLIIGAGIAGLSSAISLSKNFPDLAITLIEKRPNIAADNSSLALPANSMHALDKLKLGQAIREHAIQVDKLSYCDTQGNLLAETAFKDICPEGEFWVIPRNILHEVLLGELNQQANISLYSHTSYGSIEKQDSGLLVELQSPEETKTKLFDFVLACDGINSKISQQLFPENHILDHNLAIWRMQVPSLSEIQNQPMVLIDDRGNVAFTYPSSAIHSYVYLHSVDPTRAYGVKGFEKADEQRQHSLQNIEKIFGHFEAFMPSLIECLKSDTSIEIMSQHAQSLAQCQYYDPELGPVIALGDAAHAMLPSLQQGAAQSFWDAIILTEHLKTHNRIQDAFTDFQAQRQHMLNTIMATSNEPFLKLIDTLSLGDLTPWFDNIKQDGPIQTQGWRLLFELFPSQIPQAQS